MARYQTLFLLTGLLLVLDLVLSQIAFSQLSKIGVIKGRNYRLKITGESTHQLMIIKLIPNTGNLTDCGKPQLAAYKDMITRILTPIEQALNHMRSAVIDRDSDVRFFSAIVAGTALTVATSAQITAGIALHNSLENAKAIRQMKEAVKSTNQAVQSLQTAQKKTVLVINALQDQINSQLVPSINKLGCSVVGNTLGLKLNQYFSEILTVFGPNLRDPASETLSIQAISHAFNGDFDSLLRNLGYQGTDFMDLLESGGIRGRIIDVLVTEGLITLQIDYPNLITIADAVVQKFNLITYNQGSSEWMPIFPRSLLKRGTYISNIDIHGCSETSNSIICPTDTSSPLSQAVYNCATGNISSCARTLVINAYAPRYALSDGVLFANCMPVSCYCINPDKSIIQEPHVTNVMISSEFCEEILIDGIYITVGSKVLNRSFYSDDVEVGGAVSIDPVDLGSEIADIEEELDKAQTAIDKSNALLAKVNPNIVTAGGFITITVITILMVGYAILTTVWLVYLTKKVHLDQNYPQLLIRNRSPTLSSLSTITQ